MKCPACGHEFKNPVSQEGGRAGGAARVPKGFASAAVQAKALATRKRKARAKRSPNAPAHLPPASGGKAPPVVGLLEG